MKVQYQQKHKVYEEKVMKNQFIENEEFQEQKLQSLFQAMLTSELFSASKMVYKKLKMQVASLWKRGINKSKNCFKSY